MTTVTIYNDISGNHKGFDVIGHSGYATEGQDIVCAAISMLTTNTINSIETYTSLAIRCEADEESASICFRIDEQPNHDSQLLIDSMILGLSELKKNYKKYVTLKFEEV